MQRLITTRRLRRTLGLAAVGLATSTATASAAIGIGVNDGRQLWLGSPNLGSYPVAAHKALALKDMAAIGRMKMRVRLDVRLSDYDTNNDGTIDTWTIPDALFKTASQQGVGVLPLLQSNIHPRTTAQRVIFGKQVAAFVARYRSGGSYWTANASLVPRAITTAEIWNEPNRQGVGDGFYYQGNATDYGRMLGEAWEATQVQSPGFRFISGGLAEQGTTGQTPVQWLDEAMSHARDEVPGVGEGANPFFPLSGVGFHAYGASGWSAAEAKTNTAAMISFTRTRRCYSSNGLCPRIAYQRPPVTLTEFGWKWNGYGAVPNTYSEAEIAARYADLLAWYSSAEPNGAAYAYNFRQDNTATDLDGGFGLFGTIGALNGDDTTQADSGRPPLQALSVLTSYTGAPYTP